MIVFDLKCGTGHVFEAWFASSAAFDEQREAAQVRCPLCDDTQVKKALMAPAVATKGNRATRPTPDQVKRALVEMATVQKEALRSSQWVGTAFADQARAMHQGERDHAPIHGQASIAEAKALAEEGVPVAPLPFPVTPPEALN